MTAGVVAENSVEITQRFYPHMFAAHPELMRVFNKANQAIGEQPQALAASVVAFAVNLIDADAPDFGPVMRRIAHKHVRRWGSSPMRSDRRPPPHHGPSATSRRRRHPEVAGRLGRGLLALRVPAHRRGGPSLRAGGTDPSSRGASIGGRADR